MCYFCLKQEKKSANEVDYFINYLQQDYFIAPLADISHFKLNFNTKQNLISYAILLLKYMYLDLKMFDKNTKYENHFFAMVKNL